MNNNRKPHESPRANAPGARRPRNGSASISMAVAAILTGNLPAHAQEAAEPPGGGLEEIIVTAQKRTENMQNVPVSIQALGTAKLDELNIRNIDTYVQYLPSVSMQTGQGQGNSGGPGTSHIYMRGVSSGGDGNHSGPLPSVGVYLDEQPVTTVDGTLDIHAYDIERVEALAGPQGTLYGASSEAGTIRIITNKPDPSAFKSGFDLAVNTVAHGGVGYTAEGFANVPLGDNAAIRLVGWDRHDAGFIDNVAGTNAAAGIVNGVRTFPTSGATDSNAALVKKDFNEVDTYGGRAALKLILNDSWTITPSMIGQEQKSKGFFGYDPGIGYLQVAHFFPERFDDSWLQSALTIEGKFSNFDLVYAGAYLKRTTHSASDYTDYSFFYDTVLGSAKYVTDSAGTPVNPSQYILGMDYYSKISHELRLTSPQDWPLRFVAGLFAQRQVHDVYQNYQIVDPSFSPDLQVPGWPGAIWLTDQERVDRDYALFGELTYDITPKLTATAGLREFKAKNSMYGFFGFNANYSGNTGTAKCFSTYSYHGGPCIDLDSKTDETGSTPRFNLSYHFDKDHMVYATFSRGFRPGGPNRRTQLPDGTPIGPFRADFLNNYEIGWKTTWLDNTLRFNGAVFREDWKDFQYAFLGPNSLTLILNAGQARIWGAETELDWAATHSLDISGGFTVLDPKLTNSFCGGFNAQGGPATDCAVPQASAGSQLPVTPKFKGNVTARYNYDLMGMDAYVQGSYVYQGTSKSSLKAVENQFLGDLPAYGIFNLSAGLKRGQLSYELSVVNLLDDHGQVQRFAECPQAALSSGQYILNAAGNPEPLCASQTYIVPTQPRTIQLQMGWKF